MCANAKCRRWGYTPWWKISLCEVRPATAQNAVNRRCLPRYTDRVSSADRNDDYPELNKQDTAGYMCDFSSLYFLIG